MESLVVIVGPGRFARITGSFGVASTVTHGNDGKTLINLVDKALYRAKELGRNRVVVAELPAPSTSTTSGVAEDPIPLRPGRRTDIAVPGLRDGAAGVADGTG